MMNFLHQTPLLMMRDLTKMNNYLNIAKRVIRRINTPNNTFTPKIIETKRNNNLRPCKNKIAS